MKTTSLDETKCRNSESNSEEAHLRNWREGPRGCTRARRPGRRPWLLGRWRRVDKRARHWGRASAGGPPLPRPSELAGRDNSRYFISFLAFALSTARGIVIVEAVGRPVIAGSASCATWLGKVCEIFVFNIGETFWETSQKAECVSYYRWMHMQGTLMVDGKWSALQCKNLSITPVYVLKLICKKFF